MPANTDPIHTKAPDIQWSAAAIAAANTAKDGTGTVTTVFTADATNGGFVSELVFKPTGANTNATVARAFINNGSTNTVVANNSFVKDITLPAITNSEVAAQNDYIMPINRALPAGYKINVTLGTAPSAGGWQVTVFGGKY